ncbi:MAG: OmpA family protein [Gemmatimonadales bacterium]
MARTTRILRLIRMLGLLKPSLLLTVSVAIVSAFSASSGFAQAGTGAQVELGSFGGYTSFDDSLNLTSDFGAGGRLGIFLSRVFQLEGSGDFTRTHLTTTGDEVNVTTVGGTLIANGHLTSWDALYFGAGYQRVFYRGAINKDDDGAVALVGNRLSLGGRMALRVQGNGAFFPAGKLRVVNLTGSVGLSIYAFGGPQRDADQDLVADKRDDCPDTPHGATVDKRGCPSDSDVDLVLDGLDTCPGTPSGARVDSQGCPSDADGDGVFDGIDVCPDTPSGATVDTTGCPGDEDADQVFDGLDRCPDTPRGATVDTDGCPSDGDTDGVFDGIDICPATPAGVAVDATGCPSDTDGDGVFDGIDECPDTPAGDEVDERGCTVAKDSDGDGVVDPRDRCPNTQPGQNVDAVGCPVLFVIEQGQIVSNEGRRGPLVLRGVNFASGRSVLTRASYAILDAVAASLLAYPEVRIEITGHTDATGSDRINRPLSAARARAVMAYLARKGVPPGRLQARGYGSDQPIAPNSTRAGRARNRRVELRVIAKNP